MTSGCPARRLAWRKGELAKLGITRPDQLERPLPPGLIADVQVVQRTDDNGATFNRVKTFKVVESGVPADDFRPDDDLDVERGEGDDEHLDAGRPRRVPASTREPGEDDDLDADGFDWRQRRPDQHASSHRYSTRPETERGRT